MSRDERFEYPVAGIDVLALPQRMRVAMERAQSAFPAGTGVIVFAFDFGGGGGLAYVSNAERDDAIAALKEWIAREAKSRA